MVAPDGTLVNQTLWGASESWSTKVIVVPAVIVIEEGSKFFPDAAPCGMITCSPVPVPVPVTVVELDVAVVDEFLVDVVEIEVIVVDVVVVDDEMIIGEVVVEVVFVSEVVVVVELGLVAA